MMTSVCGMDCGACENFGHACNGCSRQKGEVCWTHLLGGEACPIYLCTSRKQVPNCGACDEMPCSLFYRLHDPALTEEQWLDGICARMQRLREAN